MNCKFDDFLKIIKVDFICMVDGKRIIKKDMDAKIYVKYCIISAKVEDSKLLIGLKPFKTIRPKYGPKEKLVKRIEYSFALNQVSFDLRV